MAVQFMNEYIGGSWEDHWRMGMFSIAAFFLRI
jgi:hypothetical protein